jgi:membrane fusion protein (multidrug efflux system)
MKKLFLCLCLVLHLSSCADKTSEQANAETHEQSEVIDKPTVVKVMELQMSDFHHDLIANGTVVSARVAELRFHSNENVVRIYVKNGDRVSKGQKIAELDRFRLKNAMLQAEDQLERARLELQDVLIGQGYSLSDSLRIPTEVMRIARVKSNFDQSQLNFHNADYQFKKSVLYAPFDGVVANLFSKEDNVASGSEPFCSIIDNQHPEVVFNILENEISIVSKGDKVQVSPYAINDYSVEGKVVEINPVVDKNGMVRVKASLRANTKLLDGMNVRVLIQQRISEQLVVPKDAVVLRTNKKVVFTLKNGRAYWNYVSTGLENSSGYVVTEGLQAGDSVIVDGNINLAHESPVMVLK